MHYFFKSTFIFSISIFLLASNADDISSYEASNSVLTVPTVKVDSDLGVVQNLQIGLAEDNHWKILNSWDAVKVGGIETVELVEKGTPPITHFLRVEGNLPGCHELGRVLQHLNENTLSIEFYYSENYYFQSEEPIVCAQQVEPFTKIIPLDTYGLDAGEYMFSLNSEFTGGFTLPQHNVLIQ